MTMVPRPWVQMFVAVSLVAVNMRATITSVGPLLQDISDAEGLQIAALGALGSIPLLTWAAFSSVAHSIGSRVGMSRTISWSLAILFVGTLIRSLPGSPINLWVGTAIIGASLAACNVLMPAIIKLEFGHRVPFVMGPFSAIIAVSGSLASGAVIPISAFTIGETELGWRGALLASGVSAPIALIAWLHSHRKTPQHTSALSRTKTEFEPLPPAGFGRRAWREPVAWQIAFYMGTQSAILYTLLTWLVAMEATQGRSAILASVDIMALQALSIAGSATLPFFFRGPLIRWLPAILPLFVLLSCLGFILAPKHTSLWVALCGPSLGATYTMSLTLIAVRTQNHHAASAVSGMSQSVGYTFAAIGPSLFGWLHSVSDAWSAPLLLLVAIATLQVVVGFLVARPRMLFTVFGQSNTTGGTAQP